MDYQPGLCTMLWFADRAEEAANFYVGMLPDSKILNVMTYPKGIPNMEGLVTIDLVLMGRQYVFMNNNPSADFNMTHSFYLRLECQDEVDLYWNKILNAGGKEVQCGWITDQFGIAWQILPTALEKGLANPDEDKARATAEAMMQMVKIDVSELEKAQANA